MTIGAAEDAEDLGGSGHRGTGLAEFVALSLFVVEGLVILGFVAAGIANQVQYGTQNFGVEGSNAWGYTLSLASEWSNPAAVVAFLLGPLALVAWIRTRERDELSDSRSDLVLGLGLGLAVLTVLGGILSVVGRVLQFSPSESWSVFLGILGTGIGSVCLGIVGIVVAVRLREHETGVEDR